MTAEREPSEVRDAYVRCRAVGHVWVDFVPRGMRAPSFGYRLSMRCRSCGTKRHDLWNSRGDMLQRAYVYADEYQIKGIGTNRDQWRAEVLRRNVVQTEMADDVSIDHDVATRGDLFGFAVDVAHDDIIDDESHTHKDN